MSFSVCRKRSSIDFTVMVRSGVFGMGVERRSRDRVPGPSAAPGFLENAVERIISTAGRTGPPFRRAFPIHELFTWPRGCDDPALLVPAPLLLATAARTRLLAHHADAGLGLPPALPRPQHFIPRPHFRDPHRRRPALGRAVPRPARLLDVLPRGNVVAQHRQPHDEPLAARGI